MSAGSVDCQPRRPGRHRSLEVDDVRNDVKNIALIEKLL